MKYSQIKEVKTFTESLFSTPDFREVLTNLQDLENDFEVDNVRFIRVDAIDKIQAEELESDLYCLGCFNASFIASMTNWPEEIIQAAQDGDQFEAIGKAISDNSDMVAFAIAYSNADGYGHHFNSYDGNEEEFTFNGVDYLVFDQH